MDTFLAVISFPFWFVGIVFVLVGMFGQVTVNGVPYYGQHRVPVKIAVTVIGAIALVIAYALVAV